MQNNINQIATSDRTDPSVAPPSDPCPTNLQRSRVGSPRPAVTAGRGLAPAAPGRAPSTRSGARIALLAAMALGGMLAISLGQDPGTQVSVRGGRTRQDGEAETGADEKLPDFVTYHGEGADRIMEIRKTFTPPPRFKFDTFKSSEKDTARIAQAIRTRTHEGSASWSYWEHVPQYVDFWFDPETAILVQETPTTVRARAEGEGPSAIAVKALLLAPQTAAQYPLRCDGNLKPMGGTGGSGGEAREYHWAANIVGGIELHIDADNSSSLPNWAPERNDLAKMQADRAIRNDPTKPGRLIAVNHGDSNNNGIPDFADMLHSSKFVRAELDVTKVASSIDWATAKVRFHYSASDPGQIQTNVTTVGSITVTNYVAQSGLMRIWRKDGTALRNPASVAEDEEGDYVPAGVEIAAARLFKDGATNIPLYIEGISPAVSENCAIAVSFLPRAGYPAPEWLQDEVRATVLGIFIDANSTKDFSPHLSEVAQFTLRIVPDPAPLGIGGWLVRCQAIRKLNGGGASVVQPLDMSPGSTDYDLACPPFQTLTISWSGITDPRMCHAQPEAEGPAWFQGVAGGFHRKLPATVVGKPVPPPLYTIRAELLWSNGFNVRPFASADHDVTVPQVVLLQLSPEARQELAREIRDDSGNLVIKEFTEPNLNALLGDVRASMQLDYSPHVNLRFVTTADGLIGDYTTVNLTDGNENGPFGEAPVDFGNASIADSARVYVKAHRHNFYLRYRSSQWDPPEADPIGIPFTVSEQAFSFALTGTHELGHTLGLVSPKGGVLRTGTSNHNPPPFQPRRHMNAPVIEQGVWLEDTLESKIGRAGLWNWRPLNYSYMQFVLPKGAVE